MKKVRRDVAESGPGSSTGAGDGSRTRNRQARSDAGPRINRGADSRRTRSAVLWCARPGAPRRRRRSPRRKSCRSGLLCRSRRARIPEKNTNTKPAEAGEDGESSLVFSHRCGKSLPPSRPAKAMTLLGSRRAHKRNPAVASPKRHAGTAGRLIFVQRCAHGEALAQARRGGQQRAGGESVNAHHRAVR